MIVGQTEFRCALLDPDLAHPAGLENGLGEPSGRRFDVYRNNVSTSLIAALETAFPIIQKLVGEQNFKVLANAFFRKHPPKSPVMMFYGDEMPAFLAQFQPTSTIGYLPDVARLELAIRESYHAADVDPVDPSALQRLSPEELTAAKLTLVPSTKLVRSDWPIYSIRAFNLGEAAQPPQMASESVLVVRPEFDPIPLLLPAGADEFLTALSSGAVLGTALEAVGVEGFDLAGTLGLLLANNTIATIGTT